jgi:hypothetical protein
METVLEPSTKYKGIRITARYKTMESINQKRIKGSRYFFIKFTPLV